MVDRSVVDAVAALAPQPRRRRWSSLSYCVLDAVWSIGSDYEAVVCPLVWKVASDNDDDSPLFDCPGPLPSDPLPLRTLLTRYGDVPSLLRVTNKQRTSPRNGILKADAALRYARILFDHDVSHLLDVERVLTDEARWERVNRELARVPGEGGDGVRRGYLWMLCGEDSTVKPDRMVLGWLARHGIQHDATGARVALREIAEELTQREARPVTPWMVDHAIWLEERARRKRGSKP